MYNFRLKNLIKNLIVPVLFFTGTIIYAQSNTVTIKVYFDSAPSIYNTGKATLKYNKDFSYSFTLDDGKDDACTVAYTLFKGGVMSGNGITYPGLFYTDGCGNNVPFKAGLALNSFTSAGFDPHEGTPGSITWTQVVELYNAGWNVFNHSYSHKAGVGTNHTFEVTENTRYLKLKTGIDLTHFVIPSGDTNYIQPAFNNGMKAVYNQNNFPGNNGLKIDATVNLANFRLYRRFLEDANHNTSNITEKINLVAGQSINGNHYWFSEFTHRVGFNQTTGGGLSFPTFEYYMNYIESTYGKSGSDRIWMAPLQEVYEYLSVRENATITSTLSDNVMEIKIDFTNVPRDLRDYALSLSIDSDVDFNNIEVDNSSNSSFKGTGINKLINLEWNSYPSITAIYHPENFLNCSLNNSRIYPNPARDNRITIQLEEKNEDDVSLIIYDQIGNELSYNIQNIEKGQKQIYLNLESLNLPSGLYYIRIISQKQKCNATKMWVKY